jgi:HD-GYP domain-containing protein (c-di-GMP phosphodiesterase class II)
MRALVYSMITAAVVALYGTRVCPVIEAASRVHWVSSLVLYFLAMCGLRALLLSPIVTSHPGDAQSLRQLALDQTLYLLASIVAGIYPVLAFGSPPANGVKVFVGAVALGFFFSLELALQRERTVVVEARKLGIDWRLEGAYLPVTRKFGFLAGACVIFTALIVAAVVIKDVHENFPLAPGPEYWAVAMSWVAKDLLFVMLCLTSAATLVISSFATNLRLFFGFQSQAMDAVSQGNLRARVPVVSNDEFGSIAKRTNDMIGALEERTRDLATTQEVTIIALASLAETRDNETGNHILRTQRYVRILAEQLAKGPQAALLTPQYIDLLYQSAPLHDIGKVGIPDAILLKPGRLEPEEFAVMKRHAQYGHDALQAAVDRLGPTSFLRLAQEIALTHHEKWDGGGYPNGLKAEVIPLSGRLMALADVYDALICKRVYKRAFSHEETRAIILEGQGTHFDPLVVEAFLVEEAKFLVIAAEFSEAE